MTEANRRAGAMAPSAFAPARVDVERRAGGAFVLRSPMPLEPYARCVGVWLEQWARRDPSDRLFLAERTPEGGWRRVSYAGTLSAARALGQAFLARGLSAERPIVILSDNSIDHALLALAAMHVGVPYAPISAAYSLLSADHARLKSILALLRPGLVFADDGVKFAKAIAAVRDLCEFELVCSRNQPAGSTDFAALVATPATAAVDQAFEHVGPDTVAKLLFTSGSTGEPKGVINTQRMLCSNQQAILQVWPFLAEEPPVIVDWLPWSHTFGANHNFNMVLANGGALYVDEGKPAPGLFDRSVANLRDVAPTLYFNVPRGFDVLAAALEKEPALADHFFSRLKMLFYAAAALPQNLWERFEHLARARGRDVAMVSAWGATETAPMVTTVHFRIDRAGVIGLPAPGCELLMRPNNGKLELRVRGPNVTPGYWKRADLTKAAFDEEGFYRIGDAGKFADPADPGKGIEFDGRLAEDFKLASGTWVHVGMLRIRALSALAHIAQDVVIAGHDRDYAAFLVFANMAACRGLCEDLAPEAAPAAVIAHPRVRERLQEGMKALAHAGGGSSTYAARALMLAEPPSIDASEITDKGYINQRAVLTRRAAQVELLYCDPVDPQVVQI